MGRLIKQYALWDPATAPTVTAARIVQGYKGELDPWELGCLLQDLLDTTVINHPHMPRRVVLWANDLGEHYSEMALVHVEGRALQ